MQYRLTIVLSVAAAALAKDPAVGMTTTGVPTNCGVQGHTCCIPACNWDWTDDQGCDGQAESASNCLNTFIAPQDTHWEKDTSVDICKGAKFFTCKDDHQRYAITVNKQNSAYAIAVPTPETCTLSGQCAPCKMQAGCDKGQSLGDIGKEHNCHVLIDAIRSSGYQGSC
ncbi:hypothetical protein PWT90_02893 [Aphanocladium album]|nr:hypothetical protein PWT90_02893 [Aphanocladium album]